jgi:hypothetical protein
MKYVSMDTNKILSADILDLIFDARNKDYGAYELRRSYPQRVIKNKSIAFYRNNRRHSIHRGGAGQYPGA